MKNAKKTAITVNMDAFMRNLTKEGDVLDEFFKNMLEVVKCDEVHVDLEDREDEKHLIFKNNGAPFSSKEQMESTLFCVFNPGKLDADLSASHNFGKGSKTMLQELMTRIHSGNIEAIVRAHDDIEIGDADSYFPGTLVDITLLPESRYANIGRMDIYMRLADYITTKKVWFGAIEVKPNAKIVPDLSTMKCVEKHVYCSKSWDTLPHHYFQLYGDGGFAPIKITNIKSAPVLVIVTDVAAMDTERSRLLWSWEWRVNNFIDALLDESMSSLVNAPVPSFILAWINSLQNKAREISVALSGAKCPALPEVDAFLLDEIGSLCRIRDILNSFCKQARVEEFSTRLDNNGEIHPDVWTYCMDTNRHSTSKIMSKLVGDAEIVFSALKIGVMISGGTPDGNAFLRDLPLVDYRVSDVTDRSTWEEGMNEHVDAFIALMIDVDTWIESSITRVEFRSELAKKGMLSTAEHAPEKAEISAPKEGILKSETETDRKEAIKKMFVDACAKARKKTNATDAPKKKKGGRFDVEAEVDWRFEEFEGVPCLVHKSVKDMEKEQFTTHVQKEKWEAWTAMISLILKYTGTFFTDSLVPVIMVSNLLGHEKFMAFQHGEYLAINRFNTSLPKGKERRASWILLLVLHELCHFHHKFHGGQHQAEVEGMYFRLVRHETFLRDAKALL